MTTHHDALLLSLLATGYGSAAQARVGLDAALARAGLDALPSSPGALASFLRIHLHSVAEADLGGFIADAVLKDLLALVDGAEHQPGAPSSMRGTLGQVSVRSTVRAIPKQRQPAPEVGPAVTPQRLGKVATVLLVRVDRAEETQAFDPSEFADRVLRVGHPLPACERIRVTHPSVVVVGSAVADRDVALLTKAAREIGCEIVELGAFVSQGALREAMRRAVTRASSPRSATGHGERPTPRG